MNKKFTKYVDLSTKNLSKEFSFSVFIVGPDYDLAYEIEDMELNFNLSDFSRGYFIYNDVNFNVNDKFTFLGGELIVIVIYSKNSYNPIFIKEYIISRCDKITKDIYNPNNKNKYKVYFNSKAEFYDGLQEISKGYVGPKRTDEIVKDIIINFLQSKTDEDVSFQIDKSSTILNNFIIPRWTAKETIDYLKIISKSPKFEKDVFVFYEDKFFLNFLCLSSLLRQKPIFKLSKELGSSYDRGYPLIKIENDFYTSNFDLLQSIKKGYLARTYHYFDRKTKTEKTKEYFIDNEFLDGVYTLGKISYFNSKIAKNTKSERVCFNNDLENMDSFPYTIFRTNLFNSNILKADVTANLDLNVGQIVYIEQLKNQNEYDLMYTGNWLITALKIKYCPYGNIKEDVSKTRFKTTIIMSKDSYGDIPVEIEQGAGLIKTKKNVNNDVINIIKK